MPPVLNLYVKYDANLHWRPIYGYFTMLPIWLRYSYSGLFCGGFLGV